MLVSRMSGLGDLTSSAAHRKKTITPAGTSSAAPSISTSIRTAQSRNIANMWLNKLTEAKTPGFNPGSIYQTAPDPAKVAAAQAAYDRASKAAALVRAGSPAARAAVNAKYAAPATSAAAVANAAKMFLARGAGAGLPVVAPTAAIPGKAAAPDDVQKAVAALVDSGVVTPDAGASAAPSMSTGGGGGGGGGGDLAPADTTDTGAAPAGWEALSTTTKVAIVGGAAVVAYIGYRAMRRP